MRRNLSRTLVVVGTIVGLTGVWGWFLYIDPLLEQARIATGYMAKTVCSCVHIERRGLVGCRADALLDRAPALGGIRLKTNRAKGWVRASLFPFSAATAYYEEGFGCTLR